MGVRFIRKARVQDGKRDEAIAFASDSAVHWKETYGVEASWGFELGGETGTMYWMSDHDSLASFEALMLKSMENAVTNKLNAEAVGLFHPAQDKLIYVME